MSFRKGLKTTRPSHSAPVGLGGIVQPEIEPQTESQTLEIAISLEETTPASLFPAPLLAGNEQLGDLLLEQNQPEQALAAYEASLQVAPNRFNSLSGAGRAAELAGARSKAETYYGQLLTTYK